MLGGLGLGLVVSGGLGRLPLWSPHPNPSQPLASCLRGDTWQERVGSVGGVRKRDLTVSSIACHRVFGHLSAPSKVSVQVQNPTHSPIPENVLAPMQPCSQYVSRGNPEATGIPGTFRMGNAVLPPSLRARSGRFGELSGVWWVCSVGR